VSDSIYFAFNSGAGPIDLCRFTIQFGVDLSCFTSVCCDLKSGSLIINLSAIGSTMSNIG